MSVTTPKSDSTAPDPADDLPSPRQVSASEPTTSLASARKKLRAALEGLDLALNLRAERAREQEDQSAEFSAIQDDRSRLAQELDAAKARLRALEAAREELALRVERASAAVRAVLASDDARERDEETIAATMVDPPGEPEDAEASALEPAELSADAGTNTAGTNTETDAGASVPVSRFGEG